MRSKIFQLLVVASALCLHHSTISSASESVLTRVPQEGTGHEGGTSGAPLESRRTDSDISKPKLKGKPTSLAPAHGLQESSNKTTHATGQAAPTSAKPSNSTGTGQSAKSSAHSTGQAANAAAAKPASPSHSSAAASSSTNDRAAAKSAGAHETASDEDPGSEGGSSGLHATKKSKKAQAAKPSAEPKKD